jgi:hypothetical protein
MLKLPGLSLEKTTVDDLSAIPHVKRPAGVVR